MRTLFLMLDCLLALKRRTALVVRTVYHHFGTHSKMVAHYEDRLSTQNAGVSTQSAVLLLVSLEFASLYFLATGAKYGLVGTRLLYCSQLAPPPTALPRTGHL